MGRAPRELRQLDTAAGQRHLQAVAERIACCTAAQRWVEDRSYFRDREGGVTKLGLDSMPEFCYHLWWLRLTSPDDERSDKCRQSPLTTQRNRIRPAVVIEAKE